MEADLTPNGLSEAKQRDSVSKCKEYLKVAYNKYIYDIFKNDPILEPQEYTPENESVFGVNNHKRAWLNVPSSSTTKHKEWEQEINLCLECIGTDSFEISMGTDSEEAKLQFIRLIDNEIEREKMIIEFNKVEDSCFTSIFCVEGKAPLRKKLEDTVVRYQTNKINTYDIRDIRNYLISKLNREEFIYPRIRIIKMTNIKAEQIPEIINQMKPLISFLIDFKNNDFKQQQELKGQKKEEKRLNEEKKEEIQKIKDQLQLRDKHPGLVPATEEKIAQKMRRLKELEESLNLTDAEKIAMS